MFRFSYQKRQAVKQWYCFVKYTSFVLYLIYDPAGIEKNYTYMLLDVLMQIKTDTYIVWGTAVAQWIRCCATNRKVAGSIPDGVIGVFH